MATHSSILAWRILWTEERAAVCRVTQSQTRLMQLSMHACTGEGNGSPTPVFLPGESQEQGAWWAAVYGVAQSRTRLMRLGGGSSRICNMLSGLTLTNVWLSWLTLSITMERSRCKLNL